MGLQGIHEDRVGLFPEIKVQPIPDVVLREVNAMGVARRATTSTEDELGLTEGELIFVERELEGGWSEGHLADNDVQRGIFRTEDIQFLEDDVPRQRVSTHDHDHVDFRPQQQRNSGFPPRARGPETLEEYSSFLQRNVVGDSAMQVQFGNMSITDFVDDPIETPERLPKGWEVAYFPNGTKFYIDHNTQTTSWSVPSQSMPPRYY